MSFTDLRTGTLNGIRLAWRDSGDGEAERAPALVALHGHFSVGITFQRLAGTLSPAWRVVAPDQRGHGASGHPGDYTRDGYVGDAAALIDHLGLAPAVVLGHSLGGVNAYQLAARRPELVGALIIEDIGAHITGDFTEFLAGWPESFPTRKAARAFLAARAGTGVGYFLECLEEAPDGFGFPWRPADMIESQRCMNGDWWRDWLASTCPALLIHGRHSFAVSDGQVAEMAARRPGTELVEFADCGHDVHHEDPEGFANAVRAFLGRLTR